MRTARFSVCSKAVSYTHLDVYKRQVQERGLAKFADVFCDAGNFTIDESRNILEEARKHGFNLKIHADELENTGATELACDLAATSCDPVSYTHLVGLTLQEKRKRPWEDSSPCSILLMP